MFRPLWKFWGYSSPSSKRNLCCGLDYDLVNCLILCEFKGFTKCSVWFWTTFWTYSKNILQWSIQHSLDSYNCGKHESYDLLITSLHEFPILNSAFSRVFFSQSYLVICWVSLHQNYVIGWLFVNIGNLGLEIIEDCDD